MSAPKIPKWLHGDDVEVGLCANYDDGPHTTISLGIEDRTWQLTPEHAAQVAEALADAVAEAGGR